MKITVRSEGDVPFAEPLPGQEGNHKSLSQNKREEKRKRIWRELRETKGQAALEAFLAKIEHLEGLKRHSIDREELCRLRLECITALLGEAEENFEAAQNVITRFLLPVCLRPRRDIPLEIWKKIQRRRGKLSASARSLTDINDYWSWREAHEAREQLENWFQSLTPLERKIARVPLLQNIHEILHAALADFDELALRSNLSSPFHVAPFSRDDSDTAPLTQQFRRVQAAILSLSAIGYRDEMTDTLLGELMERDDSIGSAALSALASLGVPPQYAARVQEVLQRQVYSRPQAHIGYAFQELADGSQFDAAQLLLERSVHHAVEAALIESERTSQDKDASPLESKKNRVRQLNDWEIEGNASLVRVFLERHPQSNVWHDRIWNVIWTLHRNLATLMGEAHATFLGSGGKFLSCNSPWMARDILLFLVPSFGDDPGDEHHAGSDFLRGLSLESLEKCVQPRVLDGLGELAQSFSSSPIEVTDQANLFSVALPWLERDATFNTYYEGSVENSLRRLKRRSWRLLLALGVEPPTSWLQRAFEEEGSGHMRGDVCEIAGHLRVRNMPQSMLKLTREPFDTPREPPYPEFRSRMGVQRLLGNSATRPAFDALLHAGFTMDGDLMRATIDHLGECAFSLYREGDTQVVYELVSQAKSAAVSRHREAAVGALRLMAVRGCVSSKFLPDLLQLARSDKQSELPAYARATLVEMLGYIEIGPRHREEVIELLCSIFEQYSPAVYPARRVRGEHDLGWYAAETLIKLKLWQPLRPELFQRLGLEETKAGQLVLRSGKVDALDNRTSTILGMLWRQGIVTPQEPWSAVIVQVLDQGSPRSLAPILNAVVQAGYDLTFQIGQSSREMVAEALVSRIYQRQTLARAEISLFEPLAVLSPKHLLQPAWEREWREWLPDARVALAEAIGQLPESVFAELEEGLLNRGLEILRSLMGDGLYAVRRAAYRVLRRRYPMMLWLWCSSWVNDDDPELRQRAAEATAWLPAETQDNSNVTIQALLNPLRHDREEEVRAAAKRSISERRKRELADSYLQIVERAVVSTMLNPNASEVPSAEQTNEAVLSAYRYSRALIHVGQDDHLKRLRELSQQVEAAPHVRYWIEELLDPLESNWKDVTRKWPQPWLPWEGDIEEVDGFVWAKDKRFRAHFSLWQRPAATSQDYADWGGAISQRRKSNAPELLELGEETALELGGWALIMADEMHIEIPGRPRTPVHATRISTNQATLIRSNEPYPSEQ